MIQTLRYLQKNLIWTIPTFMIFGLLYGKFFDVSSFKALILPLTFFMVYPMMVSLKMNFHFSKKCRKVLLLTQGLNFLVIPFLGLFIGKMFFADKPFAVVGLLLTSLLPTSGMTISWTGFAKGNMLAAVKITVFGLILGSVLTPFYLDWLVGESIVIPLVQVFKQIALIVFAPMLLGLFTQKILVKKYGQKSFDETYKKKFPPFAIIGVLGIVFIAMALKSSAILNNPALLWQYFLPLIVLYAVNFALSTIVGKTFLSREDAIALVYGTVMRNLSIALAIAMTVFGKESSEIAIIIALAYVIQAQSAAWYVKFTDIIFGKESILHKIKRILFKESS
ncbi:bile acid:sodium symporter [Patescibacteria group bacterium]|nr:bile acid:sodium symporter [Patescibacteria group bacterium]MBU1721961.1 bile acid:sodium symporter [Patescibacteria group bacterium]